MLAVGTAHLAPINTNGIVRDNIACVAGWANEIHGVS